MVNGFSGVPGGSAQDATPNWVTCPWPPDFLEMLAYQWDEVAIPYWRGRGQATLAEHHVKMAFEMHPGMLVYNVETMLRLREAAGPALGCNFDPSHLFWNGVDPVAAIRRLGDAIYHVHGKDCYVDPSNISVNGCNDNKPYGQIANRAWTFRTIGYGHDAKAGRDIISALRLVGYDYVISIEHEDPMMSNRRRAGQGGRRAQRGGHGRKPRHDVLGMRYGRRELAIDAVYWRDARRREAGD